MLQQGQELGEQQLAGAIVMSLLVAFVVVAVLVVAYLHRGPRMTKEPSGPQNKS